MAPKSASDPDPVAVPKLRRSQRAAPIEEAEDERRHRLDEGDEEKHKSHKQSLVPADPSFAINVPAKPKPTVYQKARFNDEIEEISDATTEEVMRYQRHGKLEPSSADSVTGMAFPPPPAGVPEPARERVRPKGRVGGPAVGNVGAAAAALLNRRRQEERPAEREKSEGESYLPGPVDYGDVPMYTSKPDPRDARSRNGEKDYYDNDTKPTGHERGYGRGRYNDSRIVTGVDSDPGLVEYGDVPVYSSNTASRGAMPRNGISKYYNESGYTDPARTARDDRGYYSDDQIDRQDGDRYTRRPHGRREARRRSINRSVSSYSGSSYEEKKSPRWRGIFEFMGISYRSKSVESSLEAAQYREEEDRKEKLTNPTFPGDVPGRRDSNRAKSGTAQQHEVNRKFASKMDTVKKEDNRSRDVAWMKQAEFESLIAEIGTPGMFYNIVQVDDSPMWVLNLTTMQRMNIHIIQKDLVELASEIQRGGRLNVVSTSRWTKTQGDRLKTLMKDYCQAWRDWKLIDEYGKNRIEDDPFSLISTKELSYKLMKDAGLLDSDTLEEIVDAGPDRVSDMLPGYSRHEKDRRTRSAEVWRRFFWGVGGGLALIGPMLIMRLHRTLLTQLLTAGISVMLFALGVAVVSGGVIRGLDAIDLAPQDVLTATAAYAAVLVVFISQGSG